MYDYAESNSNSINENNRYLNKESENPYQIKNQKLSSSNSNSKNAYKDLLFNISNKYNVDVNFVAFSTMPEGFSDMERLGDQVYEQFGYGLGFTALTLYMLYFSKGSFQTSHYAFCTAISYLGLMLPGMLSGWLKDMMGYRMFFIVVMLLCLITFVVTALIKIDPEFGKKVSSEE